MIRLGVNIDHVATVRQARGGRYPDPVDAAFAAERGGADGITVHLREDRRHIQERDVKMLLDILHVTLNLEMAASEEMVRLACEWRPADCCLVPEKRQELTTEGGLDVVGQRQRLAEAVATLTAAGIRVSLFIDPDPAQVAAAAAIGAPAIELHTGVYAGAVEREGQQQALDAIKTAVRQGLAQGLIVNAGHGLHYHNVQAVAALEGIHELNIGHSIVSRALMVGMEEAVREMKRLMREARR
ncbi:MAG: pyridoxine 5'-phosphate synthase [Magnetococcales bacterium]|nr:pyridoxine 5'-phosphate synthase [Magnetococcales bacterium]NGZ26163.1 pyridoxine 5'-phosphate synthase [Magnetococcales bacterium]